MSFPITLTTATGRCGTKFLEQTFKENFSEQAAWISHEYLREDVTRPGIFHRCFEEHRQKEMLNAPILKMLADWRLASARGPCMDFGWTMRQLIPFFCSELGDELRVLYVHRHPVSVAASFTVLGNYTKFGSPNWAIDPNLPYVLFPQFRDRWGEMTPFEKCLFLWVEINAYSLELRGRYPNLCFMDVRSEDLFKSDETLLDRIASFVGFRSVGKIHRSQNKNERRRDHLIKRPIRGEWVRYSRHPEVIEMGNRLGYCMDEEYVGELIRKYQLPPGISPWIIYKTQNSRGIHRIIDPCVANDRIHRGSFAYAKKERRRAWSSRCSNIDS